MGWKISEPNQPTSPWRPVLCQSTKPNLLPCSRCGRASSGGQTLLLRVLKYEDPSSEPPLLGSSVSLPRRSWGRAQGTPGDPHLSTYHILPPGGGPGPRILWPCFSYSCRLYCTTQPRKQPCGVTWSPGPGPYLSLPSSLCIRPAHPIWLTVSK